MGKKRKKNRRNKTFKKFTLLLLIMGVLGVMVWKFPTFFGFEMEEGIDSISLERRIKGVMASSGIKNSEIINRYQEETAGGGIIYRKTVRVSPETYERFSQQIKASVPGGVRVKKKENGGNVIMKFLTGNLLLNELKFYLVSGGRVAVIVDDVGYSRSRLKQFLDLDIPLTFAVLPGLRYSGAAAEEIKSEGQSIILHMPMEPESYPKTDPGSLALMRSMDRTQIEKTLESAMKSVPGVKGMNNHMGSGFTSDSESVDLLMDILQEKRLFFVDSMTSSESRALSAARDWGVPAGSNRVFLDNKDSRKYIKGRLDRLLGLAEKKQDVIAICHATRKHTAEALRNRIGKFRKKGVRFVWVEDILK